MYEHQTNLLSDEYGNYASMEISLNTRSMASVDGGSVALNTTSIGRGRIKIIVQYPVNIH